MSTPLQALQWWAADATDPAATPPWDQLGQYGLAGLVIASLAWFVLGAWKRETARADRLETENRELNAAMNTQNREHHTAMEEKVIPAVLASVNAITEVTELLRDQQRERRNDYARGRRDGDTR